jgi:TonB family protein
MAAAVQVVGKRVTFTLNTRLSGGNLVARRLAFVLGCLFGLSTWVAPRLVADVPPEGGRKEPGLPARFEQPKLLYKVDPEYPASMLASRIIANVVIEMIVDSSGNPVDPVIVRSNCPAFDEPSIRAALRWKFRPGLKDGNPVAVRVEQPVVFGLRTANMGPQYSVTPPHIFNNDHKTADVIVAREVVYPYELEREQVEGSAAAVIQISESGRVLQVGIVSSTRPEFGMALGAALQGYQFAPAMKDGHPVRSRVRFEQGFNYEDPPTPDDERLLSLEARPSAVVSIAALDSIPQPLSQRPPLYPGSAEGKMDKGSAVVEFLIQEDGAVRLPRIVKASRPEFGYAAVEAVASWIFSPPTVHGKAVVARARMPIDFVPQVPGEPAS